MIISRVGDIAGGIYEHVVGHKGRLLETRRSSPAVHGFINLPLR